VHCKVLKKLYFFLKVSAMQQHGRFIHQLTLSARWYLPVVGKVELVQPHAAQDMLRQLLSLLGLQQDHIMLKSQTQSRAFSQQEKKR
jgi:hypothetical protein